MGGSHCSENMTERTSPTDAMERLSWILNYVDDGPQSLNALADQSDLSWATVQKYINTIETIQKIAPETSKSPDGVETGSKSRAISDLIQDPVAAFTVYLFTQAEMRGSPAEPVDKQLCEGLDEEFENALEQAKELGWVTEVEEEKIKLTPTGIRVAGPAKSEVENADRPINENDLNIHHTGSEEVITLANEPLGNSELQEFPEEGYNTDEYDDDPDPVDNSGHPAAA